MRLIFVNFFSILLISSFLQGCETLKSLTSDSTKESEKAEQYTDWDAAKFYAQAKQAMDKENYQKAIELYETLESRYPFGEYAAQTQLDVAYAYFKNEDSESALAATERFIKINPRNPHIDYAYYLKGLISYNRNLSFLNRFLPTDTTQRDPSGAKEAYANFAELERRFPKSQYLADARQRMIALRNSLAMSELNVARFYMRRQAYMAAVNRANGVVKDYQRTPAVPYALQLIEEAYTELGLTDLARDTQRIYAQNYPDGPPVVEGADNTFAQDVWDFFGLDQ